MAKSFTFQGAWRRGQHCVIPAWAFYEPDWRTGAHIPTRITRADGRPLAYWGLVAASTTAGTTIADYLDVTVGLGQSTTALLAPSKKSFSSVSSPILACSGARFTGADTSAPLPKASAACSSNCRFHSVISS